LVGSVPQHEWIVTLKASNVRIQEPWDQNLYFVSLIYIFFKRKWRLPHKLIHSNCEHLPV
jgi:hypothetical protein